MQVKHADTVEIFFLVKIDVNSNDQTHIVIALYFLPNVANLFLYFRAVKLG